MLSLKMRGARPRTDRKAQIERIRAVKAMNERTEVTAPPRTVSASEDIFSALEAFVSTHPVWRGTADDLLFSLVDDGCFPALGTEFAEPDWRNDASRLWAKLNGGAVSGGTSFVAWVGEDKQIRIVSTEPPYPPKPGDSSPYLCGYCGLNEERVLPNAYTPEVFSGGEPLHRMTNRVAYLHSQCSGKPDPGTGRVTGRLYQMREDFLSKIAETPKAPVEGAAAVDPMRRVLELISAGKQINPACEEVGVRRQRLYERKDEDAEFAAALERATELGQHVRNAQ